MTTKTAAPATKAQEFDQCMKAAAQALHEAQIQLGKASMIMGEHAEDSYATGADKHSFLYTAFVSGDIFSAEFQVSDIARRVRSMRRQYAKLLS